ncbi:MAG: hypothetical protein WBB01_07800 [Phormidesmis sp.]
MQGKSTQKQKRAARNRKRSKRRAILCPVHTCHLESRSPKYKLSVEQIRQLTAQATIDTGTEADNQKQLREVLQAEWIETFWCAECQQQGWYHIREVSPRCYKVELASAELCQLVSEDACDFTNLSNKI